MPARLSYWRREIKHGDDHGKGIERGKTREDCVGVQE
jgi:hypothetical protein